MANFTGFWHFAGERGVSAGCLLHSLQVTAKSSMTFLSMAFKIGEKQVGLRAVVYWRPIGVGPNHTLALDDVRQTD